MDEGHDSQDRPKEELQAVGREDAAVADEVADPGMGGARALAAPDLGRADGERGRAHAQPQEDRQAKEYPLASG